MRSNDTTPAVAPGPPADPRSAWERIAYTWLETEVDAALPVTVEQLARDTSVTPQFARDLLRVLRAQRDRDPSLSELRRRLVRDRLTDAYLRRELGGGQRLDPATLAAELGTTTTVARQWLHALRAQHASEQDPGMLSEPVSHGTPSAGQLAGLQAHFATGGHQRAAVTGRPAVAEQVAAEVERAYWTREARAGERLSALRLARELGAEPHLIATQLRELRAGPATARERIEQLWQAHQHDPGIRPSSSSQLAHRLGVTDSYVRHVTWQLRTREGIAPLADRLAASREQLTTPPTTPAAHAADGVRDWRQDAACRDADPELFFPEQGQLPQVARAKEVCAGCAVRGPCLDNALHGPLSRDDQHGIFAGTTARDRRHSVAGLRWPRAPGSCATGPPPSRPWRWPTRSASTAPPATSASPSRRCGGRSTSTASASPPSSKEGRHGRASSTTATPPKRRGGAPPRSASTRPARSSAPATRRSAPPGPATASACHPAPPARRPRRRRWTGVRGAQPGPAPHPRGAQADQAARLRREEEIQTLGYRTVVALNGESRVAPKWRVAAITRRAQRAQTLARQRESRSERRQAERAERAGPDRRPHHRRPQEREVGADAR